MLLKPKTRSAGASLKREDERLSRSGWWPWIYACLTVPVTGLPFGLAVTDPLRPSLTPLHQIGKVRSGHRGHQYSTSASDFFPFIRRAVQLSAALRTHALLVVPLNTNY